MVSPKVISKIIEGPEELLVKVEALINKENKERKKDDRISIRLFPEELQLIQNVSESLGFKNISQFARETIREKVRNTIIPKNN